MTEQILSDLRDAVLYFDPDDARRLAQKALDTGVDPVVALEEGLARPLREIGDRFGTGEAFITELIAAAQAMEAGAEVLNEEIARRGAASRKVGTFLIGTVEGDIHSIGKNIVATMLSTAGFEVIDLGTDVPTDAFVDSALMTTTMAKQKEVIEALREAGLRDGLKIIVGGAPVTEGWVEEIGADACGLDAVNAVEASLKLMEGR